MSHPLRVQGQRPNSIRICVSSGGGITVDNGVPGLQERDKVWARAGGNVAFVIENLDALSHHVRIPSEEFKPSEEKAKQPGGPATDHPLVAGGSEELDVAPNDVEIIKYRVQDAKHLGFTHRPPWNNDPDKSMTYKYNIYTRPAGGKEKQLDPDIEIDQL